MLPANHHVEPGQSTFLDARKPVAQGTPGNPGDGWRGPARHRGRASCPPAPGLWYHHHEITGEKNRDPAARSTAPTEPGKGLGEADSAQDDSDHEPPARRIAGQVHNPQPTVELETHKAEPQSDQVTAEPPPRARSGPRLPPPARCRKASRPYTCRGPFRRWPGRCGAPTNASLLLAVLMTGGIVATAGQFTQWYLGTYSMYPSAAAPRGRGRGERLLPPRSSVPGAEPRGRGRGGSEQGRRRPPPRAWGLAGGRGRGRRPPPQGLDAAAPLCSAQPATLPAGPAAP